MISVRLALLAAVLPFATASSPTFAQTMFDCQSIAKPKQRLTCYDKLSPPIAADARRRPSKANVPGTDFDKEDARMKQLLRPICRNC